MKRADFLQDMLFRTVNELGVLEDMQTAVDRFNRDNPSEQPISHDDCPWLYRLASHRRSADQLAQQLCEYLESLV